MNDTASKWPGAFGIFKPSKRVVGFNLWPYLIALLLGVLIQSVPDAVNLGGELSTGLYIVLSLVFTILSIAFTIASTIILLAASRSEKMSFGTALSQSWSLVVNFILLSIVTALVLAASILLFIIPFFFVLPRIYLASYYLIDQKLGPIESLKKSWNESKGHAGKFYGIIGVTILMALLFITIIGIPVAIFLLVAYSAAGLLLYQFITKPTAAVPAPEAVAAPAAPTAQPLV